MEKTKAKSIHTRLFLHALSREVPGEVRNSLGKNPLYEGWIEHDGGSSEIRISNLGNPLVCPPTVDCGEAWIRRNVDWHYLNRSSSFCWVLYLEWQAYFLKTSKSGVSLPLQCRDAAKWLAGAMRLMLSRHWAGYEFGILSWHAAWEAYSHGQAGIREFEEGRFGKL